MRQKYEELMKRLTAIDWNTNTVFCCYMGMGLLFTFFALLITNGEIFSKIFFVDVYDTGMDFFHSIEYTKGRSPYELYNTLYPPLANLLFYILFCMVPSWQHEQWADSFVGGIEARGTSADLRVFQPTMLMFIVFIMIFSALFVMLISRILVNTYQAQFVTFFMLFSYTILFAIERGNIIVISLLFTIFFVFFRNSDKVIVRELALLSLALAGGLKIYPAVFGILLVYEKQYKRAFRAIVYGLMCFILPFFAFKEGISGIGIFFRVLFSFTDSGDVLSANGFSFNRIVTAFYMGIDNFLHVGLNTVFLQSVLPKISFLLVIFLLIIGFFAKQEWHRTLICCLVIILFSEQGVYILSFLLIPLLEIMKIHKKVSVDIIIPHASLMVTQVMLPLQQNRDSNDPTAYYLRFQICICILLLYVIFVFVKELCKLGERKGMAKMTDENVPQENSTLR